MIYLYNFLWGMLLALGWPLLIPIILMTPKRRLTCLPRLGLVRPRVLKPAADRAHARQPRPIWVHALSVGEVLSAAPLVDALMQRLPDYPIAFSTSSLSGFSIARDRLAAQVDRLFYFPYDLVPAVRHVVHQIDPSVVVLIETDIWPNFVRTIQRRNVPLLLVNGRLSETSYRRYRRFKGLLQPIWGAFKHVTAQSEQDAIRYRKLGVNPNHLKVIGNLKYDRPVPEVSGPVIDPLAIWLKSVSPPPKVLLAGSTHDGEEEIVREVFMRLRERQPEVKLLLAPRDPARARTVHRLFARTGCQAVLWSEPSALRLDADPDIIVVGFIGVLAQLYALADVAFVGKSLIPQGGQNPLEAAAFAKPVLVGPHTFNFDDITRKLIAAGGARRIGDSDDFYRAAATLLADPGLAQAAGERGRQVFLSNQGALTKTLDLIEGELRSIAGTPTPAKAR